MSLHPAPCFSNQCLGAKDQLAVLVALSTTMMGTTFQEMNEVIIPSHRGMTESQAYEHLIAEFTPEQIAALTPEEFACWRCLPEQRLWEMWIYLVQQAIASLQPD